MVWNMKLYAMRHGRTNYNELGLCNDDPSRDVHLTKTGINQAEQAAEQMRNFELQRLVISELPRTRQTAEIINRYHQAPITVHAGINDIKSGFDGQPVADYFAYIHADPLHTRPVNGESLLDHKQRVGTFLDWLRTLNDDPVLVIAHEETLRAISAWLTGIRDEDMPGLHFDNCQLVEFSL